jgi:hypothetical protein
MEGLFEWLLIPFGLTNSLENFMRVIENIICLFTNSFIVVYLDGILIFSKT